MPALSVVLQDRSIPCRDNKTVFLPFAKSLDMTIREREEGQRRPLSLMSNGPLVHLSVGLYVFLLYVSLVSGNCQLCQRCNRIARSPAETTKTFFCPFQNHLTGQYRKGEKANEGRCHYHQMERSFICLLVCIFCRSMSVCYLETAGFVRGATGSLDPPQNSKKNVLLFQKALEMTIQEGERKKATEDRTQCR